ncbi:fatty-acid amide hydrolase 2-A [Drosophila nasuta]|uniref:fatty-acid amide hydrolase 2-A n=1 Tax=Drosophila nasuta TaxID=42062 RepID=UPI00295EC62A|nr:fatty-acid amide hydrolase 2-A [Drosophila nasuta]XP_060649121.1 fatty-acid amide hydrolase 2-A [Drosophila nasuta]
MEVLLRILATLLTYLGLLVDTILGFMRPRQAPNYPPIKDPVLLKSVIELVLDLKRDLLTSEQLVKAYIARVREVNPSLNAVIEERFEAALQEARHADELIANAKNEYDRVALFTRYSLLGIPFTVKESCGLKGLSFSVGSVVRKGMKAPRDGDVVALVRAAGGIPLLVSANPEFCMSFETNTVLNGRCLNPYDLARTTGGSSGGEAALNGCGASTFGIASDISGSIRLPAMFCGVYGHKPTGGLTSVHGHFPYSTIDENFPNLLQIGPITRFARDMPLLLEIMAGDNKHKLNFAEPVALKEIKIHYAYGFSGTNSLTHPSVHPEIQLAVARAVKCFEKAGLTTKNLDMSFLDNSMEVALVGLLDLKGLPSIVTQQAHRAPKMKLLWIELFNSIIGHSLFTKEAIFIELMQRLNGFMSADHMEQYREEARSIKTYLTELLGDRGVLLLPTFHDTALNFHTSLFNITGIDNLLIFNVLGFPATQVAMGFTQRGMPIGIQVVAAPYQDKLCLQIAAELEGAFRGWAPPVRHQLT